MNEDVRGYCEHIFSFMLGKYLGVELFGLKDGKCISCYSIRETEPER
jgi:hypothetical protein